MIKTTNELAENALDALIDLSDAGHYDERLRSAINEVRKIISELD
jgi:hypothetical protein